MSEEYKTEVIESLLVEIVEAASNVSESVNVVNLLAAAKIASQSHFMNDLDPLLRKRLVEFGGIILCGLLCIEDLHAKIEEEYGEGK